MRSLDFKDVREAVLFAGLSIVLSFTAVVSAMSFTSDQDRIAKRDAEHLETRPR